MVFGRSYLAALMLVFCCAVSAQSKPLTAVAEAWQGYTEPDGQGIYWQIVREAMLHSGYQIQPEVANWKRARHQFEQKNAELLIGATQVDMAQAIFPRWHLDFDDAIYLFTLEPMTDLQQLQHQTVAFLLGYQFERYLSDIVIRSYEVSTTDQVLDLLQLGRIQAFIGYHFNLPETARVHQQQLRERTPLYVVFQPTERGQKLAAAYEQGMAYLYQSGRLQEIFANDSLYRMAGFPAKVNTP